MGKLTLNLPNRARDEEIEVPPLGLLENGHTYEIEGLAEDVVIGEEGAELPVMDLGKVQEGTNIMDPSPSPLEDPEAETADVPLMQLDAPVRIEDTSVRGTPATPPSTSTKTLTPTANVPEQEEDS